MDLSSDKHPFERFCILLLLEFLEEMYRLMYSLMYSSFCFVFPFNLLSTWHGVHPCWCVSIRILWSVFLFRRHTFMLTSHSIVICWAERIYAKKNLFFSLITWIRFSWSRLRLVQWLFNVLIDVCWPFYLSALTFLSWLKYFFAFRIWMVEQYQMPFSLIHYFRVHRFCLLNIWKKLDERMCNYNKFSQFYMCLDDCPMNIVSMIALIILKIKAKLHSTQMSMSYRMWIYIIAYEMIYMHVAASLGLIHFSYSIRVTSIVRL